MSLTNVRAATTAAITLNDEQTVDAVALVDGDSVLVKNQVAGAANGIYEVVKDGPWKRRHDKDHAGEIQAGLLVAVERGTANGDKVFELTTNNPITLGTTALVFSEAIQPNSDIEDAQADVDAAELEIDALQLAFAGQAFGATFGAIGAEAANKRTVPVQLKDIAGADLAVKAAVHAYISTDNAGVTPLLNDALLSVGAAGELLGGATDIAISESYQAILAVSTAGGDIDVVVEDENDSGRTLYVNIVLPNGKVVTSPAVVFADDTP